MTTTTLTPPATPIRQFNWDPIARRLSAEISETHGLGRVYDDACDAGMTVVGRTGRQVVFVVDHTEVADGDIRWWTLRPASADLDVTITLFND